MHQPNELTRQVERLGSDVVARPDLGPRRGHEPARVQHRRQAVRDLPPPGLVGDGEVVAFFAAREGLVALKDLLQEEDVVVC